ncbi:MAG: alpha/beta hydrolase, partial [Chloroflexota bacterium]
GETLVLLHGLLGSVKGQWADFADFLSESHSLLMVDMRNHGRSSNKDTRLKLSTMAADVIGLIRHLGLSDVHLSGYSLGGNVGLLAAATEPSLFSTVNLISTKYYWKDEEAKRMQQQVDPDTIGAKAPTYATQLAQEHGAANWRGLARHTADIIGYMCANPLSSDELAQIETPIMVTVGDRDNLISLPEAYKLSRQLPKGGLLVLPNTGHTFNTLPFQYLIPVMQQFHFNRS